MSEIHPVMKRFLNFGCNNQRDAAVAFQVYLDLVEVQNMWDVKYAFSTELSSIYFWGKEAENQTEPVVFIPLSSSQTVSPSWLLKAGQCLSSDGSLVLALKDNDCTIVYYRVVKGLVSPDSMESLKTRKEDEENERLMQSEILRQKGLLFEMACQSSAPDSH